MKANQLGVVLAAVACFSVSTSATAGKTDGDCDVVSLSGNGTRLESGAIVGNETLTIVATGEQIPREFHGCPAGNHRFSRWKGDVQDIA